jgi:hypothetical protein
MDSKSTYQPTAAERRIQLAERFADHDRYLAFHPNALRALRQPVPKNPLRAFPSLSRLTVEAEQGSIS